MDWKVEGLIRCKKCGKKLDDNDKFCMYCGEKVENEQLEETQTPEDNIEEKNDNIDVTEGRNFLADKRIRIIVISSVALIILGMLAFTFYKDYVTKKNAKAIPETVKKENPAKSSDNKSNSNSNSNSNNSKTSSSTQKSDEYIFPHSNDNVLTAKDIQGMSKDKLALARNEIFARHGYSFPSEPFKSYFGSKSWYKASNYSNDFKELSPLERHNVKIILVAEGKGKSAAADYDKDYYESSSKKPQQKTVSNYIRYMTEAINKNNYSIVSPYIATNSELAKAQKKLITDFKNVQMAVQDIDIEDAENITGSSNTYKVKTHERYIIFNNGKIQDKEVSCIYTLSEINNNIVITDIKN